MVAQRVRRRARPTKVDGPKPRRARRAPSPEAVVPDRTSDYRGTSPEASRAAYYADARAMIRMGYAPASEDWSSVLEHVLTVRYVFAPERSAVVLAALDEIEAEPEPEPEPAQALPDPRPAQRTRLRQAIDLHSRLPIELTLFFGAAAGIVAGIGLCMLLGLISGDDPDGFALFGFGLIGMVLGGAAGLPRD